MVVEWAGNVRDVSVFGWQVANFERYWMQQIGARRANALGGVVARHGSCGLNDRTLTCELVLWVGKKAAKPPNNIRYLPR
jgi:hypothetical protein